MGAMTTRSGKTKMQYRDEKKVKRVTSLMCEIIEHKRKPPISIKMAKHKTRWCSGFCKLCGEHMDVITNLHAQTHGYESADALIKAGHVQFD